MANVCFYRMKAVSRDESVLRRLVEIMNYRDGDYFIYRCFIARIDNQGQENGLFTVELYGENAWSCYKWFDHHEDVENLLLKGYEKREDGTDDWERPLYGTAHSVSLDILCGRLGFGVEVYSEEWMLHLNEHFGVRHDGEFFCEDYENPNAAAAFRPACEIF